MARVMQARTVAIVGLAAAYLSIGMEWVMGQVVMGNGVNPALQSTFLDYPGVIQPYAYTDTTWDGWIHIVLGPYLAAPVMILAYLLSSGCLVACIVAVFRWRYMWVAGSLGLAGASLWTVGIYAIPSSVANQLCSWHGYTGQPVSCANPVEWLGPGPYFMTLAGAILLIGYLLSRKGVLEVPVELNLPYQEGGSSDQGPQIAMEGEIPDERARKGNRTGGQKEYDDSRRTHGACKLFSNLDQNCFQRPQTSP
jgi:hypothetical protein